MSSTRKSIADLSSEDKRALLSELTLKLANKPKRAPLSFAQERLWLLDQLFPGNSFFNVPHAVPLNFPVNVKVLERSLNEIVRRHESLRTTFAVVENEPVQVIRREQELKLEVLDLCGMSGAEQVQELQRVAQAEAQRPFDLEQGPLLRALLVKQSFAESHFLLTMHHIVSDGWSLGIFFQELTALYLGSGRVEAAGLKELPIQYADFAMWQREWLQGEVLEQQLAYWRGQLAGLPVLQLGTDRVRPVVQSYRGAYLQARYGRELTRGLKELSQREGVTLFMTLLAAFKVLLHRYTGQSDIVVGSPIANRNRTEIEGLIGFFVNTLVLRTDLSGAPSFLDVLQRVKETAKGAYAHQDLPFEMLVEQLQPERDLGRNPLFQINFQLFNAPTIDQNASKAVSVEVDRGTAIFDLTFNLWEDKDFIGAQ